jgi:DeoR/GlpR family transcriptional regulator of sugar metabolism
MMTYFAIKRELAMRAAERVSSGETVFIENGSCNALLARTLAERGDITIITVSSYIAHLLKETPGEVILLGGIYQKRSESMVGPLTRQFIQQVHFSKAFIGIDGWQLETGFTGRDMMRADVVNAVLEKGCEAIVLSDSSKFSVVHPYPLGPVGRFDRIITDSNLHDTARQQLADSGLTVDIVNVA